MVQAQAWRDRGRVFRPRAAIHAYAVTRVPRPHPSVGTQGVQQSRLWLVGTTPERAARHVGRRRRRVICRLRPQPRCRDGLESSLSRRVLIRQDVRPVPRGKPALQTGEAPHGRRSEAGLARRLDGLASSLLSRVLIRQDVRPAPRGKPSLQTGEAPHGRRSEAGLARSYLFAKEGRGFVDSHTCRAIIPGTVAAMTPLRPTGDPANA
jgi:hypothetical protein